MKPPRVRFTVRRIVAGAVFLAGAVLLVLMSRPTSLSEPEVIRRAERFIAVNGYTDLPANRSRLTPEPIVFSSGDDEEMQARRDTLERKADGALGGADGWVVYFRYKYRRELDPVRRRAVVMDANGGHIHVMHQDAY